jgi:hypothetical protein
LFPIALFKDNPLMFKRNSLSSRLKKYSTSDSKDGIRTHFVKVSNILRSVL